MGKILVIKTNQSEDAERARSSNKQALDSTAESDRGVDDSLTSVYTQPSHCSAADEQLLSRCRPIHQVRFSPGKRGGSLPLPCGGRLTVPPDTLTSRRHHVITCHVILPHERYRYEPITRSEDERLCSEVTRISSSGPLKGPLVIHLEHKAKVNDELTDVILLRKESAVGALWTPINITDRSDDSRVGFETSSRDAVYVIVTSPRGERFDVPLAGCLHVSRVNRGISVRFPKAAVSADMHCTIQMTSLSFQAVPQAFASDIVSATDIISVRPSLALPLRRTVTLKLPLPPAALDQAPPAGEEELGVYQQDGSTGGWEVVEAQLKLTQNSVTFDTKALTQYCVALVRAGRKQRACEALRLSRELSSTTRGDLLTYLRAEGKAWTLWVDCVRTDRLQQTTELVINSLGLQIITRSSKTSKTVSFSNNNNRSRGKEDLNHPHPDEFVLTSGATFELEVGGDLELLPGEGCDGGTPLVLTYHDALEHNFRRLEVAPRAGSWTIGRMMRGVVRVYTLCGPAPDSRRCVRLFDFALDAAAVATYFHAEPEPAALQPSTTPAPEPPQDLTLPPPAASPSSRQRGERPRRDAQAASESFERLTRPTRPPTIALSKDAKVLSGRSLRVLSTAVERSVALAMHLGLSESAVTGLKFDCMASGRGRDELTYRVLLLWKRCSASMQRDSQVAMLIDALEALGEGHLAGIVAERHSLKEEIGEDCFCVNKQNISESSRSGSCGGSMTRTNSDMHRYAAIANRQPLA